MPGVVERERKGVLICSGGGKARPERRVGLGRRVSIADGMAVADAPFWRYGACIDCFGAVEEVVSSIAPVTASSSSSSSSPSPSSTESSSSSSSSS